jgi:hypothetical protein
MRVWLFALLISALALAGAGTAAAAGFTWSNHAAPLDFTFGNDIDSHQQTHQGRDGNLFGYLYIHFTGETTTDGYRVATHVDCSNAALRCTVGWLLRGQPGSATFLYQVMGDHPIWLVSRSDIPQPGGYSHFHWLHDLVQGNPIPGYFLELTAIDFFCFVHTEPSAMAITSTGKTCGERGGVIVTPGLDVATHTNIVTSVQNGASGM